jgi:polyphosphate kinase 2 (PPK2 family)
MDSLSSLSFPVLSNKNYDSQLRRLQKQLSRLQIALFQQKKRAMIVFEGTDAAGKGGAIRRMIRAMDPRGYRVYSIGPPSKLEAERHYLHRFWRRIPRNGQIAIFDRSWYGRVLVERVEGLIHPDEWQRAYREINNFERLLFDDDVIFIKLFLHISKEEQRVRFLRRWNNPDKQWKLTKEDLRAHELYSHYIEAFDEMLEKTSIDDRSWHVIPADNKNYARINVLSKTIDRLSANINVHETNKPSSELSTKINKLAQK